MQDFNDGGPSPWMVESESKRTPIEWIVTLVVAIPALLAGAALLFLGSSLGAIALVPAIVCLVFGVALLSVRGATWVALLIVGVLASLLLLGALGSVCLICK
jgi:hypothetical protein